MIETEMDIGWNLYFWTSVYNDCQINMILIDLKSCFIWTENFSLAQEQRKTTPSFLFLVCLHEPFILIYFILSYFIPSSSSSSSSKWLSLIYNERRNFIFHLMTTIWLAIIMSLLLISYPSCLISSSMLTNRWLWWLLLFLFLAFIFLFAFFVY